MIYLIVFLFEAFICYFYDKMQLNNVKPFYVHNYKLEISFRKILLGAAILLPLWFVMGLRYNIGIDYRAYENIFKYIAFYKKNAYDSLERGYYYLNRVAADITQNPQILFFLVAFLINFLFFKGIEKSNGSMYYGVLSFMGLGYYFYAMNGQRQYIAIMIMFYALHLLEKRRMWEYFICVIVAVLFHKSAIIFVPIYFAINYIPTKIFLGGSLGIAFAINRFGNYFLDILADIGFYTSQIRRNESFFKSHFSLVNVGLSGLFLFCGAVFHKQIEKKQKNIICFKLVWITFLIYSFFYQFGQAGVRIASYMCIAYFLLLSEIVSCFSSKLKKWIRILILIGLHISMFIIITYSGNNGQAYLPYKYRLLWEL